MSTNASAQDSSAEKINRHGICIDFRVNSTAVDSTYRNNENSLALIESLFKSIEADSLISIKSIKFCGSASPEGHIDANHSLSKARMNVIESIVKSHYDIPQDIIIYEDLGVTWDYLYELVEEDTTFPSRDEILKIIRSDYPEQKDNLGRTTDGRIIAIRNLRNGNVLWDLLAKRFFDEMRNACFIMITSQKQVAEPVAEQPEEVTETVVEQPEEIVETIVEEVAEVVVEQPEEVTEVVVEQPEEVTEVVVEQPEEVTETVTEQPEEVIETIVEEKIVEPRRKDRVPVMNIKTNLPEVAALIPNIGFEFRLGPRWSLDINGHYSPHDYFRFNRKCRIFATEPELRFWWGESLIKGHFVGIHAPVAGFNIQLNDEFRYQDPNRALWGVGISYGYAVPMGKDSNWGIQFVVGLGYMNIKYDTFEGVHNGKLINTTTRNYFGPTRLGIDITYRFNKKNRDTNTKILAE